MVLKLKQLINKIEQDRITAVAQEELLYIRKPSFKLYNTANKIAFLFPEITMWCRLSMCPTQYANQYVSVYIFSLEKQKLINRPHCFSQLFFRGKYNFIIRCQHYIFSFNLLTLHDKRKIRN